MRVYPFSEELVSNDIQLFPNDICDDFWILYQGTSSNCAREHDDSGFRWKPTFTKSEIEGVVKTFEAMSWSGKHPGGFAVLKPFSLDLGFGESTNKPIGIITFHVQTFVGLSWSLIFSRTD